MNRYTTDPAVDGLPHGEAAFLPCTFWLADNYRLQGRREASVETFQRLLSEEYDPAARRLVGKFPQTFSHVGLVNTAFGLEQNVNRPVA